MTRRETFPANQSSPVGNVADASVAPVCNTGASVTGKMPCLSCDDGTVEIMGLLDDRYHSEDCRDCDGTGLVDQVCETCQGPLTRDRFCFSCDDFTLVHVERIAPGRIAA